MKKHSSFKAGVKGFIQSNSSALQVVSLIALFVTSVFLLDINLPPPNTDELYAMMPAFNQLGYFDAKDIHGAYIDYLAVNVFNKDIFFMINPWTGPYSYMVYLPGLLLFGPSLFAVRITKVIVGVIFILLFYLLCKRFFNKETAYYSSLLLISTPYFVNMYRVGFMDDGLLPVLVILASIYLNNFLETANPADLCIAFFIIGTGIATKVNFLWYLIGVSISLAIFIYRRLKPFKLSYRTILYCLLSLIIGASPLIVFSLKIPAFNTFKVLVADSFPFSFAEKFNNLNIFNNLVSRFREFGNIFSSTVSPISLPINLGIFSPALSLSVPIIFFVLLLAMIKFIASSKDRNRSNDAILALVIVPSIVMFLLSIFTPTRLRIEHLTILLPLAFLFLGSYLSDIEVGKKRNLFKLAILFILICTNYLSLTSEYAILSRGKFTMLYEDWSVPSVTVNQLTSDLMASNASFIDMTRDYDRPIYLLSGFKAHPVYCRKLFDCIDPGLASTYLAYSDTLEPLKSYIGQSGLRYKVMKNYYHSGDKDLLMLEIY